MNSYHAELLHRSGPLDPHEVADLREWLSVLKEDVELFGATPEDEARMRRIEAMIARADGQQAPP